MREYGYLEKMLDMLTDPYTHRIYRMSEKP